MGQKKISNLHIVTDIKVTIMESDMVLRERHTLTKDDDKCQENSPCGEKSLDTKEIVEPNLHEGVRNLIYWVNIPRSIGTFGYLVFLIYIFKYHSVIAVPALFCIALTAVAVFYRLGYVVYRVFRDPSIEHPFTSLLKKRVEVSEVAIQRFAGQVRFAINNVIYHGKNIILVKEYMVSLKAILLLWLINHFSCCIDLTTLCTLGVIALFSVPKVYEAKQKEVDKVLLIVKDNLLSK